MDCATLFCEWQGIANVFSSVFVRTTNKACHFAPVNLECGNIEQHRVTDGSVMAWARKAAKGNPFRLYFIHDCWQKSQDEFRSVSGRHYFAPISPNASELIGWRFTVRMDNNLTHTERSGKVMQQQSIENQLNLRKTKLKRKCEIVDESSFLAP